MKFIELLNLPKELEKKLSLVEANILDKKSQSYKIILKTTEILSAEEMILLIEKVKNFPLIKIRLKDFYLVQPNVDKLKASDLYWYIYQILKRLEPLILMSTIIAEKINEDLYLYYTSKTTHEKLEPHKSLIEKLFKNFGLIKKSIFFTWDDTKLNHKKLIEIEEEKIISISNSIKQDSKAHPDYKNINPKTINDDIDKAYFEGFIFKMESRVTKNDRISIKYGLFSSRGALYVNSFFTKQENLPPLKENDFARFYGRVKYNSFSKSYEMTMSSYEKLNNVSTSNFLKCNSERKRHEFNVHTKMSQMDGVASVEDYFLAAKKYNISSINFSDSNVVQSYPDIANLKNKYPDIKAIYGVELDVYDDIGNKIVLNEREEILKNAQYVFFDLETTGLFAETSEIIEIGCVKVKDGVVIEKFETFVKPKNPIPQNITAITGIKNDDVKNAPSIEQIIKELKEFFEDSILVAHNASFDIAFIKKVYRDNKLGKVLNPVIDSLKVSWLLNPTLKNHRLGTIAKHTGILYDETIAHRAQYDAEILYKAYENLYQKMSDFNIKNLLDFNKYVFNIKNNIINSTVNVIAKNQQGLKRIFYLVSQSHTSYFNNLRSKPSLPLSLLLSERKNILIGSGGQKSLIWEILNYKEDEIEEYLNYFDFIEVHSSETFSNLFLTERMNLSDWKKLTQKLVKKAFEKNIKVIISSNAYYATPNQKIARDVYIANKGIGGKPHYLFNYQNPKQENPNQHLRTTTELINEFSKIFSEDILEKAIFTNPEILSKEIENGITPLKEGLYTPKIKNSKEEFLSVLEKGKYEVYGNSVHPEIEKRIEKETNSIVDHGFSVIYYLSYKITNKSISDGYLVGSRGSVGSSIVATLSNITEVNPLKPHYICKKCKYHEFDNSVDDGYDLPTKNCPKCNSKMYGEGHDIPFETFLGFEGNKVPDIDLNFAGDQQLLIHDYVKELVGQENVYRAGTISTTQQRTAFGYVKAYLETTQKVEEYNQAEIDYITSLVVGTKRTTGQHPGGIIIVPSDMDIYEFTPINFPGNDSSLEWKTTHFDFHTIHDNLLKLDILGHVDPSVLKMLKEWTGIDPKDIDMNLPEVISIFSDNKNLNFVHKKFLEEKTGAIGLPEFGTYFVRQMLLETKPKTFADLIRISGLSHGTDVWEGNAKELIKNNVATLKEVISVRDGIMLYLINKGIDDKTSFSITEDVRKGKGLKPEFEKIMLDHNVPRWYIDSCKKIKYMFPKAHATAYVIMAYRIAWYKIYYPLEFYATFFSKRDVVFDIESLFSGPEKMIEYMTRIKNLSQKEITKKETDILSTYEIVLEMYSRGFKIQPISLEKSSATSWVIDKETDSLIPPFNIMDSLGEKLAEKLVKERTIKPFESFEDFEKRSGLNKTIIERMKSLNMLKNLSFDSKNQKTIFDFLE